MFLDVLLSSDTIRLALFLLRRNQAWLGAQLGVSKQAVSQLLRAQPKKPTAARSKRLAEIRAVLEAAGATFQPVGRGQTKKVP